MRIDRVHTAFPVQPNIYAPLTNVARGTVMHALLFSYIVKNGSSTSSCWTAGVAVGFSTITYIECTELSR